MIALRKRRKTRFLTKSTAILTLLVLIFLVLAYVTYRTRIRNPEPIPTGTPEQISSEIQEPQTELPPKPVEIKESLLLEVPFTSQAPTANWDELHNDACEEASAIMTAEYFAGNTTPRLTANFVESEIDTLTQWQQKNLGYYLSITTEETAQMIESVYNLKTSILPDFTEQDIKEALNQNQLVILPANGQLLNNPNFKQPGPIYHMLVVIGYDERGFITNDPGTRNGKQYRYDFDTLYAAAAEWDHNAHTTDTNNKSLLIVEK